jgi:hypothetical protein
MYCMPSSRLKGKERGQHVLSVFLVRIFPGVLHAGDYMCCNVAWLHLVWVGVFASTPPIPRLGHACTHAFWPMWDWHREALYCQWWQIHTVRGRWMRAESKFNHNFKIKFQTYFILKLFLMVTSSDLCLLTQLAMSISPQGLHFEI